MTKEVHSNFDGRQLTMEFSRQDTLNDIMEVIRADMNGDLDSPMIGDEESINLQPILEFLQRKSSDSEFECGLKNAVAQSLASTQLSIGADQISIDGDDLFSIGSLSPSIAIHHFPDLNAAAPEQTKRSVASIESQLSINSDQPQYSSEYRKKRIRNNNSVRKCREKKKMNFQLMCTKTQELERENNRLQNYVERLRDELIDLRRRNERLESKFKKKLQTSRTGVK